MAEVPAGKPLILVPELTALPALSQYRLEIVDESRNQAFLTYAPGNNQVWATVVQGLPSGAYYVPRLWISGIAS